MLEPLYEYLNQKAGLSKNDFNLMERYFEVRHFGKEVQLVDIGERENYVNFILTGLVRKYFYRHNEEAITQLAKESDLVCSSVSFLSGQPSTYVVETIEPTTTISISRDNLEAIYSLGNKMERLGRLVITDWLLQKEYWENDRLVQTPKERFVKFIKENPGLLKRIPQKYLASYLNIKPETFSRYKHLLEDAST